MSVDCNYVRHFSNSPNASCHFVKTNADCQDVGGFINYIDVSMSALVFLPASPPVLMQVQRGESESAQCLYSQASSPPALLLQLLLFPSGRHHSLPGVALQPLRSAGHRGRRLLLPQPRRHLQVTETLPERRRGDHFSLRKWGPRHFLVSRGDTTSEAW